MLTFWIRVYGTILCSPSTDKMVSFILLYSIVGINNTHSTVINNKRQLMNTFILFVGEKDSKYKLLSIWQSLTIFQDCWQNFTNNFRVLLLANYTRLLVVWKVCKREECQSKDELEDFTSSVDSFVNNYRRTNCSSLIGCWSETPLTMSGLKYVFNTIIK